MLIRVARAAPRPAPRDRHGGLHVAGRCPEPRGARRRRRRAAASAPAGAADAAAPHRPGAAAAQGRRRRRGAARPAELPLQGTARRARPEHGAMLLARGARGALREASESGKGGGAAAAWARRANAPLFLARRAERRKAAVRHVTGAARALLAAPRAPRRGCAVQRGGGAWSAWQGLARPRPRPRRAGGMERPARVCSCGAGRAGAVCDRGGPRVRL